MQTRWLIGSKAELLYCYGDCMLFNPNKHKHLHHSWQSRFAPNRLSKTCWTCHVTVPNVGTVLNTWGWWGHLNLSVHLDKPMLHSVKQGPVVLLLWCRATRWHLTPSLNRFEVAVCNSVANYVTHLPQVNVQTPFCFTPTNAFVVQQLTNRIVTSQNRVGAPDSNNDCVIWPSNTAHTSWYPCGKVHIATISKHGKRCEARAMLLRQSGPTCKLCKRQFS